MSDTKYNEQPENVIVVDGDLRARLEAAERQRDELKARILQLEIWVGAKPGSPLAYLEALEAEHNIAGLIETSSALRNAWAVVEAAKKGGAWVPCEGERPEARMNPWHCLSCGRVMGLVEHRPGKIDLLQVLAPVSNGAVAPVLAEVEGRATVHCSTCHTARRWVAESGVRIRRRRNRNV